MSDLEPAYLETFRKGLFEERIKQAYEVLAACTLCPRQCPTSKYHEGIDVTTILDNNSFWEHLRKSNEIPDE